MGESDHLIREEQRYSVVTVFDVVVLQYLLQHMIRSPVHGDNDIMPLPLNARGFASVVYVRISTFVCLLPYLVAATGSERLDFRPDYICFSL